MRLFLTSTCLLPGLILSVSFSLSLIPQCSSVRITRGPDTKSFLIGGRAQLFCRVEPFEGAFTVQWMKDEFGYPNETLHDSFGGRYAMPGPRRQGIYDLHIKDLEIEDDGEYICQVHIKNRRTISSRMAELKVVVPPKSISLSRDRYPLGNSRNYQLWARVNTWVSLTCKVNSARPAAQLSWFILGRELTERSSSVLSIKVRTQPIGEASTMEMTDSTLTVKMRPTYQGKLLECRVSNSHAFHNIVLDKMSVKLNIQYIEQVNVSVSPYRIDQAYREHDMLTFTCHSSAYPHQVLHRWSLEYPDSGRSDLLVAGDLKPDYRVHIQRSMHKAYLRCTVISTLEEMCRQQKDYYIDRGSGISVAEALMRNCTQENTISMMSEYQLQVLYAPIILDATETTVAATMNDIITLECLADANPPPTVTWYKNTPNSGRKNIADGSNYSFKVNDEDKFGMYSCVARTPGFPDASKLVYVGESGAPEILSNDKVFARRGEPVKITCRIRSIPQPRRDDIVWKKSESRFIADNTHHVYNEDYLEGVHSVIYISTVKSNDYGAYNCTVSNDFGHASRVITLYPTEEAPLAFAIGSAVAVFCALCFTCIIVCIVKRRSCAARKLNYVKGSTSPVPHSDIIQSNLYPVPDYLDDPHPNWDGLEGKPCCYHTLDRGHMPNCPSRIDTLRRVIEWREDGVNITQDAANSTRSGDSGVCPDDGLTPAPLSASLPPFNSGLPPFTSSCNHKCTGMRLPPLVDNNIPYSGNMMLPCPAHPNYTLPTSMATHPTHTLASTMAQSIMMHNAINAKPNPKLLHQTSLPLQTFPSGIPLSGQLHHAVPNSLGPGNITMHPSSMGYPSTNTSATSPLIINTVSPVMTDSRFLNLRSTLTSNLNSDVNKPLNRESGTSV